MKRRKQKTRRARVKARRIPLKLSNVLYLREKKIYSPYCGNRRETRLYAYTNVVRTERGAIDEKASTLHDWTSIHLIDEFLSKLIGSGYRCEVVT